VAKGWPYLVAGVDPEIHLRRRQGGDRLIITLDLARVIFAAKLKRR